MVFNEPKIITIYLAGKSAPSWYIQYWTCFWKFRGELPGCSLPNCGISWQDLYQHHLETRAASVWDFVQSDQ